MDERPPDQRRIALCLQYDGSGAEEKESE